MAYSDLVLAGSPRIYWKLNENATAPVNYGSLGGNATIGTDVLFNQTGIPGNGTDKAIKFGSGTGQAYVRQNLAVSYMNATYTVETWFKTTKTDATIWIYFAAPYSYMNVRADGTLQFVPIDGAGSILSTVAVNDGNWHHAVAVYVPNGVSRLYLDGTQIGTVSVAHSTFSTASYLEGSDHRSFSLNGTLDEFAFYPNEMSAATVLSHYNAGANIAINGGYTAQASTGSGLMVDPTLSFPRVYTAAVATGSGEAVQPNVLTNTRYATEDISISNDAAYADTVQNGEGTSLGLDPNVPGQRWIYIKTPFTPEGSIDHADLVLNVVSVTSGSVVVNIGRATADWSESAMTLNNKPGATDEFSHTFTVSGTETIDVTSIVQKWASSIAPNYGFVITRTGGSGTLSVSSSETASASRPKLALTYGSPHAIVGVMPFEGSGLASDPAITTPLPNYEFTATTLDGSGEMPGGIYTVPTVLPADVMTGSGEATDVTIATERGLLQATDAGTGHGIFRSPLLEVNGVLVDFDETDPYRKLILATTDDLDVWYRLDEASGTVIHDGRKIAAKDADIEGNYSMDTFGPESRRAFHFDNGWIKRRWTSETMPFLESQVQGSRFDDADTIDFTYEVVLRTTQKDGLLAYGIDRSNPTVVISPYGVPFFRTAITLKNGRVTLVNNIAYATQGVNLFEWSGFKDVADGEWHHIAISVNRGDEYNLENGLRLYIDGKLDRRTSARQGSGFPGIFAVPDSFFGMPDAWRTGDGNNPFPIPANFVGDAMEVVFRRDAGYNSSVIQKLYYAAMGIFPIEAGVATGTGTMTDASAKGNRKRALVLWTRFDNTLYLGGLGEIGYEPFPNTTYPDQFDHAIPIGRTPEPGEGNLEMLGYILESYPIMREEENFTAGPYRDPVNDLPRLINLQEDIDLDRYDLIMFRNWPDEGPEQSIWGLRGYSRDAVEDFLQSVRDAVIEGGISLEVTNPALAVDLGLISSAKPIPLLWDKDANSRNEIDPRAADINPWDSSRGANVQGTGAGYLDMHANNWHRVVANVENLTDIEGVEYLKEMYATWNDGLNFEVNIKHGYKLDDTPLSVSREILDVAGFFTKFNAKLGVGGSVAQNANWANYVWAISPGGLRVGTPLYKFAGQHWRGRTLVENPYKEYIGGAVVQPGDVWNGRRVAGKVFMNFAENPFVSPAIGLLPRQLVPPNDQIPNFRDWEDAEKRDWDYSYIGRVISTSIGNSLSAERLYNLSPKWASTAIKWSSTGRPSIDRRGSASFRGGGSAEGLTPQIEFEKYPVEFVFVPSWAILGFMWLGDRKIAGPGEVIERPLVLEAIAEMPEPMVLAEHGITINAEPATAIGIARNPLEVDEPDVDVLVFPAIGSGAMGGFGNIIYVEPADASGVLVEPFNLSALFGAVNLFLYNAHEALVYLKEGSK